MIVCRIIPSPPRKLPSSRQQNFSPATSFKMHVEKGKQCQTHNQLEKATRYTMKPSTNALLLLLLQIATIASSSLSSSSSLADGQSPPSGVTCADSSSLNLNECLTPGKAICSSNGKWVFGIDETDHRIKLWQGDQVRFIFEFFIVCITQASRRSSTENLVARIMRPYKRDEADEGCHRWHISPLILSGRPSAVQLQTQFSIR